MEVEAAEGLDAGEVFQGAFGGGVGERFVDAEVVAVGMEQIDGLITAQKLRPFFGCSQSIPRQAASDRGGDRSRASAGGRQPRTDHSLRAKDQSHPRPHLAGKKPLILVSCRQGIDKCGNILPHPPTTIMFSETVKSLRLQKRLTLRDFCDQAGLDPSNWSKVERGINPPPGDVGVLESLATFFGLTGADKLAFMDEAALQRGELPPDVADHALLQKTLPAFFRAARGHELTEAEMTNLAEDIRKLHTRDAK